MTDEAYIVFSWDIVYTLAFVGKCICTPWMTAAMLDIETVEAHDI